MGMGDDPTNQERLSQRLVLKDEVSTQQLQIFAEAQGWHYAGMLDRDPDRKIYRELKWEVGDGISVHYVEDEFADERFIMAMGDNTEGRIQTLTTVSSEVEVWELQDLLYEVSGAAYPAGRSRAVMRLGVGAPLEADDLVVSRISRASQDPDKRVRKAAVWAIAYTDWPEFRPTLERFIEQEEDAQLAHSASLILQSLGDSE